MPIPTRLIKRRIRSVANTRKITKAMELVAAAKMRKSVQQTLASRPYASALQDMADKVRLVIGSARHPLMYGHATRPAGQSTRTLVVVAASDRGLCGGFNTQLLKKSLEFLRGRAQDDIEVVTVGRRAELALKRAGYVLSASFEAISNEPSFVRARPVGDLVYASFMQAKVDRVFLVYTDFKSAISYLPIVKQLLPIVPENDLATLAFQPEEEISPPSDAEPDVLFEPNPASVLDTLLPRMVEMQIYQALLESSASEHSARMMAMRNATDNASAMLDDLTFTFNQARQASITREISEISAGKAAIE